MKYTIHKAEQKPIIDKAVLVYTERFGWTQGWWDGERWHTLDDLSVYEEILYWTELPEIDVEHEI